MVSMYGVKEHISKYVGTLYSTTVRGSGLAQLPHLHRPALRCVYIFAAYSYK